MNGLDIIFQHYILLRIYNVVYIYIARLEINRPVFQVMLMDHKEMGSRVTLHRQFLILCSMLINNILQIQTIQYCFNQAQHLLYNGLRCICNQILQQLFLSLKLEISYSFLLVQLKSALPTIFIYKQALDITHTPTNFMWKLFSNINLQ